MKEKPGHPRYNPTLGQSVIPTVQFLAGVVKEFCYNPTLGQSVIPTLLLLCPFSLRFVTIPRSGNPSFRLVLEDGSAWSYEQLQSHARAIRHSDSSGRLLCCSTWIVTIPRSGNPSFRPTWSDRPPAALASLQSHARAIRHSDNKAVNRSTTTANMLQSHARAIRHSDDDWRVGQNVAEHVTIPRSGNPSFRQIFTPSSGVFGKVTIPRSGNPSFRHERNEQPPRFRRRYN